MKQTEYIIAECVACHDCRPFAGSAATAAADVYVDAHNDREHAGYGEMITRRATPLEALLLVGHD